MYMCVCVCVCVCVWCVCVCVCGVYLGIFRFGRFGRNPNRTCGEINVLFLIHMTIHMICK